MNQLSEAVFHYPMDYSTFNKYFVQNLWKSKLILFRRFSNKFLQQRHSRQYLHKSHPLVVSKIAWCDGRHVWERWWTFTFNRGRPQNNWQVPWGKRVVGREKSEGAPETPEVTRTVRIKGYFNSPYFLNEGRIIVRAKYIQGGNLYTACSLFQE